MKLYGERHRKEKCMAKEKPFVNFFVGERRETKSFRKFKTHSFSVNLIYAQSVYWMK